MAFIKNQIIKRLEKFIKNLSSDMLTISLVKGEAKLSDVQLDEKALMEILKIPAYITLNSAICNEVYIKAIDCIEINIILNQNIDSSKNLLDSILNNASSTQNLNNDHHTNTLGKMTSTPASSSSLIDKIIEGVKMSINTVVITISLPSSFIATIEISSVLIQSTTYHWKPSSLKLSRISLKEFGTYLHFKEILWNNTRVEIQMLNDLSSKLNLNNNHEKKIPSTIKIITNQNKLQLTTQKFFPNVNTYPSTVLNSSSSFSSSSSHTNSCQSSGGPISIVKSHFMVDSILWIVNESQILDLVYVTSAFLRIAQNFRKSSDDSPIRKITNQPYNPNLRLIPILQRLTQQKQNSSKISNNISSPIINVVTAPPSASASLSGKEKYAAFLKYLVYEESSHLEVERFDLHLVQQHLQTTQKPPQPQPPLIQGQPNSSTKLNPQNDEEAADANQSTQQQQQQMNKSLQITFEKLMIDIYPRHPTKLGRSFLRTSTTSDVVMPEDGMEEEVIETEQLTSFWDRLRGCSSGYTDATSAAAHKPDDNYKGSDLYLLYPNSSNTVITTATAADHLIDFASHNIHQKLTRIKLYGDLKIQELSLYDTPPFNGLILFHRNAMVGVDSPPPRRTSGSAQYPLPPPPPPFLVCEFSEYFYAPFLGGGNFSTLLQHPSLNLTPTIKTPPSKKTQALPNNSNVTPGIKIIPDDPFRDLPLPPNSINCRVSGIEFVTSYDTLTWLTVIISRASTLWNDYYLVHIPFTERYHTDTHLEINHFTVVLPSDYGKLLNKNVSSSKKTSIPAPPSTTTNKDSSEKDSVKKIHHHSNKSLSLKVYDNTTIDALYIYLERILILNYIIIAPHTHLTSVGAAAIPKNTQHHKEEDPSHQSSHLAAYLQNFDASRDQRRVDVDSEKFPNRTHVVADDINNKKSLLLEPLPQITSQHFLSSFDSSSYKSPNYPTSKLSSKEGDDHRFKSNKHLWDLSYTDKWLINAENFAVYYKNSRVTSKRFHEINNSYAWYVNAPRPLLPKLPKPLPLFNPPHIGVGTNHPNVLGNDAQPEPYDFLLEPINLHIWLLPIAVRVKDLVLIEDDAHDSASLELPLSSKPPEGNFEILDDYSNVPGFEHIRSSHKPSKSNEPEEAAIFDYQVLTRITKPREFITPPHCDHERLSSSANKDTVHVNLHRQSYVCLLRIFQCFTEMSENFTYEPEPIINAESKNISAAVKESSLPVDVKNPSSINYGIHKEIIRVKMSLIQQSIIFNLYEHQQQQHDILQNPITHHEITNFPTPGDDTATRTTTTLLKADDSLRVYPYVRNEISTDEQADDNESVTLSSNILSDEEDDSFTGSIDYMHQHHSASHSTTPTKKYSCESSNNIPNYDDTISIKSENIFKTGKTSMNAFLKPFHIPHIGNGGGIGHKRQKSDNTIPNSYAPPNVMNLTDQNIAISSQHARSFIAAQPLLQNNPILEDNNINDNNNDVLLETGIDSLTIETMDEATLQDVGDYSWHHHTSADANRVKTNPLFKSLRHITGRDSPAPFCRFELDGTFLDVDIWKNSDLSGSVYRESYHFDFKLQSTRAFVEDDITHRISETNYSRASKFLLAPPFRNTQHDTNPKTFLKMRASYTNQNRNSLNIQLVILPDLLSPFVSLSPSLPETETYGYASTGDSSDSTFRRPLFNRYVPLSADTSAKLTELLAEDPALVYSQWHNRHHASHPEDKSSTNPTPTSSPYSFYLVTQTPLTLNLITLATKTCQRDIANKSNSHKQLAFTEFPFKMSPFVMYKTYDSDIFTITNQYQLQADAAIDSTVKMAISQMIGIKDCKFNVSELLEENASLKRQNEELKLKLPKPNS